MSVPVALFYLMEVPEISDNCIKWVFCSVCGSESAKPPEAVNVSFDPWIIFQVCNEV